MTTLKNFAKGDMVKVCSLHSHPPDYYRPLIGEIGTVTSVDAIQDSDEGGLTVKLNVLPKNKKPYDGLLYLWWDEVEKYEQDWWDIWKVED